MKKYNYKDHFEMLYLRHEYLTKNPLNGEFVKEYAPIVQTTARIMYDKLYPNYNKVGFDREDIVSITNVYMIGYMSIYSLRFNKAARDKYSKIYKHRNGRMPTEREVYAKDKNNMINFLRQRLQHCSTICARKARNITVGIDRRGLFAETKNTVAAVPECILESHKKLGYRKVTQEEFKECKAKAKHMGESIITDKDGWKIHEIQILNDGIKREDYALLFDSRSEVLKDPETIMANLEDEMDLNVWKNKFNEMDTTTKRRMLKRFLEKNKGNKHLKEELRTARKMLKNKKSMV